MNFLFFYIFFSSQPSTSSGISTLSLLTVTLLALISWLLTLWKILLELLRMLEWRNCANNWDLIHQIAHFNSPTGPSGCTYGNHIETLFVIYFLTINMISENILNTSEMKRTNIYVGKKYEYELLWLYIQNVRWCIFVMFH